MDCKFTTVKVAHSLECLNKAVKNFQNPQRGGRRPQISVGSLFLRLSGLLKDLTLTMAASPRQGQKPRFHELGSRHFPVKSPQGFMTYIPAGEPKLYYTDTSFDAILVRVGQFSLGGRGLTYFFLTYFLPFLILCNSLFLA